MSKSRRIRLPDIHDAYIWHRSIPSDLRGSFAVIFERGAFPPHDETLPIQQINIVSTARRGTLRGLHYQLAPYEEIKTVTVLRGTIFDVVVDLRHTSPTYRNWTSVTLAEGTGDTLYVPAGCAHGYQTLTDDVLVAYTTSAQYAPKFSRGVRWNDPSLNITWPIMTPTFIQERDANYADYAWS